MNDVEVCPSKLNPIQTRNQSESEPVKVPGCPTRGRLFVSRWSKIPSCHRRSGGEFFSIEKTVLSAYIPSLIFGVFFLLVDGSHMASGEAGGLGDRLRMDLRFVTSSAGKGLATGQRVPGFPLGIVRIDRIVGGWRKGWSTVEMNSDMVLPAERTRWRLSF